MNQREIKFRYRLRDIKTGKMFPIFVKDISEIEDGIIKSISNGEMEILSRDEFTNLKDKNGKEIFEGDIVKCSYEGEEFEDVGQVVKEVKNEGVIGWFPFNRKIYPFDNLVEVIGNVFENSNLLKSTQPQ